MVIRVAGKIILHTSALVIGLGVLLVIAIGGAAYRLSQGPVSIGFLAPYIEDALKGEDGGYGLLVDDTIITWGGWEKTLEIRVRGLRILNQARSIVATVPEATLDLSGRALFRGMLAPTRLELIGPDVRMVRLPDGRVVFGISDADDFASDPAQAEVFRKILRELTGPPNLDRPLGFLRQITVSRADLAIYDRPSKTIWRGPGTHLNLTRDVDGISGSLSTGLLLSDNIWRLNATGNYNSETEVAHLNIAFGDIDLAMLAREYEVFSALAPVEMPVSGSLSFDVGTGGSSPDAPTFAFDVSGGPGRLVLPDVYEAPVQLDAVSARGRLEQISGQVVIEDLYAAAGSAELAAQGLLFYGPEDARGAIIDVNFGGLPVEDLKKYWPSDAKPRSRKWIVENLSKGVINDGVATIVVPPGSIQDGVIPENGFDLRFALEGMTVKYMRSLPLITGLSAQGHMTVGQLELTEGVGQVGGLELTEGQFSIPDLRAIPPTAEAAFVVTGSRANAMRILDSEQLRLASKVGLDPEQSGGESATRARLSFPLKPGLNVKDVIFAAASNISGLTMPTQLDGLSVTDGAVQVRANPAGISAAGDIWLNGVPVAMTWTKSFGQSDKIDGRYILSGEIDDAARAALNIPTDQYLAGPVKGTLEVANQGQTLVYAAGKLDLTNAEVTVPPIYWSKPPNASGEMDFRLTPETDGGFVVEKLSVSAENMEAAGKVDFGPGFTIDGLDMGRLVFGENDVSVSLESTEDGGYDISLGGASYDLRPNLAAEDREDPDAGEPSEKGAPLKVDARLGRLIIEDNQILSDVTASVSYTGDLWQKAEVAGVFAGGRPVTLSLVQEGDIRKLTILSEDAGSVGKGLEIYQNAKGGKLTLTAVIDNRIPTHPVKGHLVVDDFQVVNAPVIAQILTIGSLTGIVNRLQGEGINFTQLDSTFLYDDGLLTLSDTRAYGPAVGLTLEGELQRDSRLANLSGTVVPAYTLNTVLENVPVLGKLLLGGEGEGVFAISFNLTGPIAKPRITVNPLSSLAPGFLRGWVTILTPATETELDSQTPPKPAQTAPDAEPLVLDPP